MKQALGHLSLVANNQGIGIRKLIDKLLGLGKSIWLVNNLELLPQARDRLLVHELCD
jgi:hypothetical protein